MMASTQHPSAPMTSAAPVMTTGHPQTRPTAAASSSGPLGPRAKCDQVVYESIAKAAEIVVRSRCEIPEPEGGQRGGVHAASRPQHHRRGTVASYGVQPGALGGGVGSTSGRFNIEVPEVEAVRATLQQWKRSLHVPLRLDLYYQYDEVDEDDLAAAADEQRNPRTTTRRELLERWCIDYVASSDGAANMGANAGAMARNGGLGGDDTIAQLRQVCKRVVILLRTLHCLVRIMPAYRLRQSLLASDPDAAEAVAAGSPGGLRAGRRGYGATGGYYPTATRGIPVPPQRQLTGIEAAVGGSLGYSFYVSGSEGIASEAALFGGPNSPFARQELTSVPTPFGILHLTGLYDASLNVPRAALDRAKRLRQLRGNAGFANHPAGAIPIHAAAANGYGGSGDGSSGDYEEGRVRHQSLPAPQMMHFTPPGHCHLVPPEERQRQMQEQQVRPQSMTHNQGLMQGAAGSQPSSVDGARSRPLVQRANSCLTGKEAEERRAEMVQHQRQRAGALGGLEKHVEEGDGDGKKERVLSGLSLALMESEEAAAGTADTGGVGDQAQQQVTREENEAPMTAPPSPCRSDVDGVNPTSEDQTSAMLQQRMRAALHHPPPTAMQQQAPPTQQQQASSLPRGGIIPPPNRHSGGEYGYGYNGGGVGHFPQHTQPTSVPISPAVSARGGLTSSPHASMGIGALGTSPAPLVSASPSPMQLAATPPFLPSPAPNLGAGTAAHRSPGGSLRTPSPASVRSTVSGSNGKARLTGLPAPPFSPNPLTLGPAPVAESVSSATFQQRGGGGAGPITASGAFGGHGPAQQQLPPSPSLGGDAPVPLLPPLSSLDILRTSPFKAGVHHPGGGDSKGHGSLLSSLSGTAAAASAAYYGGYNEDLQFGGPSFGGPSFAAGGGAGAGSFGLGNVGGSGAVAGALHRSAPGSELALRGSALDGILGGGGGGGRRPSSFLGDQGQQPGSSLEDMPFAVDDGPVAGLGGAGNGAAGSNLGSFAGGGGAGSSSQMSSQAVASLAHRCATAGRLKLFSSSHQAPSGDVVAGESAAASAAASDNGAAASVYATDQASAADVSALADQLAEFHTFGATLKASSGGGGLGGVQTTPLGAGTPPSVLLPPSRSPKLPSSMVGAS